jgi:hypothetical protein
MTAIITHRQSSGKIAPMVKNTFFKKSISGLIVGLFLLYIGASCNVFTEEAVTPEPEQAVIPTTIPTQAPDRVILAAASSASAESITSAQAFIAQLAAESGLEFETRDMIMANEITPDIKVIVFLEQPENLGSLAASAPNTQFVAISSQEWNPPPNGSIIRINNDHAAFLAGYLSAMIAPNYRVGALQIAENNAFNQAFVNGVNYYCGICASVVFPVTTYPVVSQQPSASPPANWQAAFNEINLSKVNVLFLPQEAATPELSAFLASQDIAVIGNAPPPEELRGKWVATINSDGLTALQEMWADLLNGVGGKVINASLTFSDLNYLIIEYQLVGITEGKMMQLEEMIKLLRDGQVYPYTLTQ